MRQIALTARKLRGIPRRKRALARWAASFAGRHRPPSDASEQFFRWKIPVHSDLVQGERSRPALQAWCVDQLLQAASHLAAAPRDPQHGYYRVAVLLVWPWLHQSEVTIFYSRPYYESFLGQANTLAPARLSSRLGFSIPDGFLEHGHDVTQPDDPVPVAWWCIGEPS